MTDALAGSGAIVALQPLFMIRAEVVLSEFRRWMGVRRLQDADHAMHCLCGELRGTGASPLSSDHARGARHAAFCTGTRGLRTERYGTRRTFTPTPRKLAFCQPAGSPASRCRQCGRPANDWALKRASAPSCGAPATPTAAPARNATPSRLKPAATPRAKCRTVGKPSMSIGSVSQFARRGGAQLHRDRTKLVSFRRTRAVRKRHARYSEGPDVVMRGVLTVTDSDAFSNLLARGIGRHRAYGYGMLLLRPA